MPNRPDWPRWARDSAPTDQRRPEALRASRRWKIVALVSFIICVGALVVYFATGITGGAAQPPGSAGPTDPTTIWALAIAGVSAVGVLMGGIGQVITARHALRNGTRKHVAHSRHGGQRRPESRQLHRERGHRR